jgi:hypothetical protein
MMSEGYPSLVCPQHRHVGGQGLPGSCSGTPGAGWCRGPCTSLLSASACINICATQWVLPCQLPWARRRGCSSELYRLYRRAYAVQTRTCQDRGGL